MFPPDKKLYPDYDKHLEASMIAESKLFFGEVLKQGLHVARVSALRLEHDECAAG